MTTHTQRLQVAFVVGSTALSRDDVVNHLRSDHTTITHMEAKRIDAERMALQEPLRQSPPVGTVSAYSC